MKKEVFCPNCTTAMFKPEGLSIMECPSCDHRYYIILTSIQKKKEKLNV